MAEILDLDALVPQGAKVKLGNKEFDVHPPSLESILRLTKLGDRVRSGQDVDESMRSLDELRAEVFKCVPGLDGTELSVTQTVGLTHFILRLGIPDDKSLRDQGITAENAKKKTKRPRG